MGREATRAYDDFTITVGARQGSGYPVFAVASDLGRVAGILPPPDPEMEALFARLAGQAPQSPAGSLLRTAGTALFRWLLVGPVETHFRLSWDRAVRARRGLRLRLTLDAPEIAALPWELLHDPVRDHTFAMSAATPLVRFYDQADSFGGAAQPEPELPLAMVLVLPATPELDLAGERELIREATAPLQGALSLQVLEKKVTRTILADTLLATPYDIMHFGSHGGYTDGHGYLLLNAENGGPDWVDADSFVRLCANARSLRLIVLNACRSGQVDGQEPFHGLAPQLVRAGIPAVVGMQYTLTDQAALTFAREIYRHLCMGRQAGQVDIAVAHARNMLAALYPETTAFAAPALYTHVPDATLFRLPESGGEVVAGNLATDAARLAFFMGSLQTSMEFVDDWSWAEREQLESWRRTLVWAEQAYSLHLNDPRPAARQAARHGLALTQNRLTSLEEAMEQEA